MTTARRHIESPSDALERRIAEMPADERAQYVWMVPVVERLTQRLLTEPTTDALVEEVSREFVEALSSNAPVFADSFASSIELLQDVTATSTPEDIAALRELLAPFGLEELGEFIVRAQAAFTRRVANLDDEDVRDVLEAAAADSILEFAASEWVSVIAPALEVWALQEAASERRTDAHLADLAVRAYHDIHRLLDLAQVGLGDVDPYEGLSPKERGARAKAAFALGRRLLDRADVEALKEAEMKPWR